MLMTGNQNIKKSNNEEEDLRRLEEIGEEIIDNIKSQISSIHDPEE